jgi:rhodanese-related sulfurtransferase
MRTLYTARPLLGVALLALSVAAASGPAFAQNAKPPISPTATPGVTATAEAVEPRRIEIPDVQSRLTAGTKMIFLDGRTHVSGKILKGAIHVPYDKVEAWSKEVPKDTMIVAYCACATEGTSLAIVRQLQALGFTNAYALKGGVQGWVAANLPSEDAPADWK